MNFSYSLRSGIVVSALALASMVSAQLPMVDITVRPGQNSDLEVYVRPDASFDGFFAGSVFTLRWDASSGAHLGSVQSTSPMNQSHLVSKSGGEQDDNGYRYQIFAGFGTNTLSDIPWAWNPSEELLLCRVLVNSGQSAFSISSDTWTSNNNGDFYISLNGSQQTGVIYETSTGVTQGVSAQEALTALPNPAHDATEISWSGTPGSAVDLELINVAGQHVWSERVNNASGSFRKALDLSAFGQGVYMLRATSGEEVRTLRIVRK